MISSPLKQPSLFNWQSFWGFLFVVAIIWSLQVAGVFQKDIVNANGWTLVFRFLSAAVTPDLSPKFLLLTLDAMLKTLAYAVCGTFFCLIIGLVGGVLSAQVWWQIQGRNTGRWHSQKISWFVVRGILAILRAIHELIWGLFFVNIFGLDPLVAIVAIAIPFGAITAKVFSEILDETPREPLLALLNSGAPPLRALIYSLLPQAFPNLLSYAFYRFECSIRSAAVLGIIGAGGLGYQIYLSLQSLRYEQVWTLIFALLFLSGCTDYISSFLRQRLGCPTRLDLNLRRTPSQLPFSSPFYLSARPNRVVNLFILTAIVLLIFSFWYVNADFTKLWSPRTSQLFVGVLQDSFPPDWSQLSRMLTLAQQTLAMSILAGTAAGIGGIFLAFGAARSTSRLTGMESRLQPLRFFLTRFLLLFARAVPEPIWALLLLFVLFPGILPGAIALAIHNLGILGRLMAEAIENLDQRPLQALKALGASPAQVFIYCVLPLTLPSFLAYSLYRWEVCIRATVIVGLVGAGGLGRLLTEQLSSFDYQGLVTTLIVFISLTFFVDIISTLVRQSLRY